MLSLARWYQLASVAAAAGIMAFYLGYVSRLPEPPSGRTPEGLLLGILGFAAMLIAGLYSARRRLLGVAMRPISVNAERRRTLKERERQALEQLQRLRQEAQQTPGLKLRRLRRQARHILKTQKMTRYIRVRAVRGTGQGPQLQIERREWAARLEIWYYWHLMLGCLSVVFILTHAGFRFGNLIATLAFVSLVGVVVTGIWGYFLYQLVPPALTRIEERINKTPEELGEELDETYQQLEAIVQEKSQLFQDSYHQEIAIPNVNLTPSWRWLFGPTDIKRDTARPDRLRFIVKDVPGSEQDDFRKMVRLIFQQEKLVVSLYPQLRYDYLLKSWLSLHIPLSAGLMVFSLIHIVSIWYY